MILLSIRFWHQSDGFLADGADWYAFIPAQEVIV